jgi:hypothetical protein
MGVALVVAIEILGVRSLAFAVGSYLSIGTTAAMFAGGLVRWAIEASAKEKTEDSEASPGALYASGLIAAGGVFGLLAIVINLFQDPDLSSHVPHWLVASLHLPWSPTLLSIGPNFFPKIAGSSLVGIIMFLLLALSLFISARKKLN